MRLFPLCLLLIVCAAMPLRADETLRRAQQALHDQGFYYGSIDGTPGDETTQAVRRYQIRNGLAVTGQLDETTRKSIEQANASSHTDTQATPPPLARPTPDRKLEEDRRYATVPPPAATPRPTQQRPPPPVIGNTAPTAPDAEDEDDEDGAPVIHAGPRTPDRPDLRVGPPPPRNGVPPSEALTDLFASTPYEFAPPAVQTDVLRRAQIALSRAGFYGGQADGVPGSMTEQALAEFQSANRMPRSGRLDVSTLAILRLLPGRHMVSPGPQYYEGRPSSRPHVIFQGRIVD